jgi:hypothetical protein
MNVALVYNNRSGQVQNVISLLPGSEHHIRFPRETHSEEGNLARSPFPFLKLDVISRDHMGQQDLDFIDCKESSGTDGEW